MLCRAAARTLPLRLRGLRLSSSTVPPPFLVEQWSGCSSGGGLSNSDCQPMKQSTLLAMANADELKRWDDLELGYGDQKGCETLRKEILGTFDEDVMSSRVVGTEDFTDASSSDADGPLTVDDINVVVPAEGIYLTMNAILEEGDEVVVAMPCYQSLHQLAESKVSERAFPSLLRNPHPNTFFSGLQGQRLVSQRRHPPRQRLLLPRPRQHQVLQLRHLRVRASRDAGDEDGRHELSAQPHGGHANAWGAAQGREGVQEGEKWRG